MTFDLQLPRIFFNSLSKEHITLRDGLSPGFRFLSDVVCSLYQSSINISFFGIPELLSMMSDASACQIYLNAFKTTIHCYTNPLPIEKSKVLMQKNHPRVFATSWTTSTSNNKALAQVRKKGELKHLAVHIGNTCI